MDNIEHALANPPALGRARWRGEYVQRHATENRRYSAGWTGVFDAEKQKVLDLSEPFPEEPQWKDMPHGGPDLTHDLRLELHRRFTPSGRCKIVVNTKRPFYFAGNGQQEVLFQPSDHTEYLRLLAWVQGRRGFLDGVTALEQLAQMQPMTFSLVNDFVCALRYQGLIPPPAIEPWIEKGRQLMEQESDSNHGGSVPFLDHWGYTRLRYGQPQEARRLLQQACLHRCHLRPTMGRAAAHWPISRMPAGCWTCAMRPRSAQGGRTAAARKQGRGGLCGFHADCRAKLESTPTRALALLDEAEGIQTASGNVMGERERCCSRRVCSAAPGSRQPSKTGSMNYGDNVPRC